MRNVIITFNDTPDFNTCLHMLKTKYRCQIDKEMPNLSMVEAHLSESDYQKMVKSNLNFVLGIENNNDVEFI